MLSVLLLGLSISIRSGVDADVFMPLVGASIAMSEPASIYFDSIASCASALGLDKSLLRKAKKDGAPGFKGSRVYPLEVLPWLVRQKAPAGDSAEALDLEFKRERNAQQKRDNAKSNGEWMKASDGVQEINDITTEFLKQIEALPSTLAPDLVGLSSVPEAELRVRQGTTDIRQSLYERLKDESNPIGSGRTAQAA